MSWVPSLVISRSSEPDPSGATGVRSGSAGGEVAVVDTDAVPGGGTLPGVTIPSAGVAVPGDVSASLRAAAPPIVARVEDGRTVCDLRTVDPSDDELVSAALRRVACTS